MGKPIGRKVTQQDRFVEAAREAGCDEDPDAFDKALKKVASAPPPRPAKKPKAKKPAK